MFGRKNRVAHGLHQHEPDRTAGRVEMTVVTDANFRAVTAGRPSVVDLWAPWCGPCRAFAPMFHAAAERWGGAVRFGSCNVDENPKTARLLQVHSIPTVVGFSPKGDEVGRLVGLPSPARLDAFLAELAALGDGRRAT